MNEQLKMKELIEIMLKSHDEKREFGRVISVSKTNAVPPGANYMSQVSRVAVEMESPSGKRTTRWLIWKELPLGILSRAHVAKGGHFTKELTFYRDILTVYEDIMGEMGGTLEILWPQFIEIMPFSRIVIEDLQPLGYKMCNEFEGLDLEHCVLAMQSLGFFHAISLLAKEQRNPPLDAFSNAYAFDNDSLASEFCTVLGELVKVLKSWGAEWDPTVDKIHSLIPAVREKLKLILTSGESSFNVLNHGDFRTSNFLFKYNQYTGKPQKMRFLDFQLIHYHTPALDLVYFLAFCPNWSVRQQQVDYLIEVYHESLTLNMDMLRVETSKPSFTGIRDEVNRLGLFKLYVVLMLAPRIFARDPDSEPFILEDLLKQRAEGGQRELNWLNFENERFRPIVEATLKEAMKNDSLK